MKPLSLKFKVSDILPLIAHTKGALERRPSWAQMCDAAFRHDGKEWNEGAPDFPKEGDVDKRKIPAGLFLVKDEGAYLMSNGLPRKRGTMCAYAKGCAPFNGHIGGDDFSEFLAVEMFDGVVSLGVKEFTILVTEENVSLLY